MKLTAPTLTSVLVASAVCEIRICVVSLNPGFPVVPRWLSLTQLHCHGYFSLAKVYKLKRWLFIKHYRSRKNAANTQTGAASSRSHWSTGLSWWVYVWAKKNSVRVVALVFCFVLFEWIRVKMSNVMSFQKWKQKLHILCQQCWLSFWSF